MFVYIHTIMFWLAHNCYFMTLSPPTGFRAHSFIIMAKSIVCIIIPNKSMGVITSFPSWFLPLTYSRRAIVIVVTDGMLLTSSSEWSLIEVYCHAIMYTLLHCVNTPTLPSTCALVIIYENHFCIAFLYFLICIGIISTDWLIAISSIFVYEDSLLITEVWTTQLS